jgi:hypothetical protein
VLGAYRRGRGPYVVRITRFAPVFGQFDWRGIVSVTVYSPVGPPSGFFLLRFLPQGMAISGAVERNTLGLLSSSS